MLAERIQQVKAKVATLTQQANTLYNVTLPAISIRFDLKGSCVGWAGHRWGQYYMRFNTTMMTGESWEHVINDTVPHELAHIVCYFKPNLGHAHNTGWKRVCRALGGNGERCHNETVVYAKGRTYTYTTTAGHEVNVSDRIHKRIQRGETYSYKHGKGQIHARCAHALTGVRGVAIPKANQPTVPAQPDNIPVIAVRARALPPTAPVAAPVVEKRKVDLRSNAEKMRERIYEAKRLGEDIAQVIVWAVATLNMSRNLARAYAKNNWAAVPSL
jgi:predicted SprT family Zn-dependent metalloprotease